MARSDSSSTEMSFLDHLEELRWRILKSIVAVAIGMFAGFFFSDYILTFLIRPTLPLRARLELQYLKPAGMFMVRLNMSLACGLALAMPVVLYQLWAFISPGLLEQEKKYVPAVIFCSTVLFLAGGAFAYFAIVPVLLVFFVQMGIQNVVARWDIGEYIGLVTKLVLLVGGVFELPMIVAFLTWIRLLTPAFLKRTWRYGVVLIFILAAVITPTPDPATQTLVAAPLLVLYFISMGVSSFIARMRGQKPAEAEETTPEEPPARPEEPASDRTALPYMGPDYFDGGSPYVPRPDEEVESPDAEQDVPLDTRPHRIQPDGKPSQDSQTPAPDEESEQKRALQQDLFLDHQPDEPGQPGPDDEKHNQE